MHNGNRTNLLRQFIGRNRYQYFTFRISEAALHSSETLRTNGAPEPQCIESPQSVGHEPDSSPDFAQFRCALVHVGIDPDLAKGNRCSESANSTAGNDDLQVVANPMTLPT